MASGYSGTPLFKKLGIKDGYRMMIIDQPKNYFQLLANLPNVEIVNDVTSKKDFIHFFVKDENTFIKKLNVFKDQLKQNGMIWISWPKRSSQIKSDVTEDTIRKFAIKCGLVDVKVCAIDDIWSGLKFVIPLKERKSSKDQ
ncbi:MAG: hypothetical protein ACJ748_00755 [Flavisolibacter sp.]